jgi:hypothetical protein
VSARELPSLPWRVQRIRAKKRTWYCVVSATRWIVFDNLTQEVAEALARPDVAALLRGEAVVVPKEPTGAMIDAGTRCETYCDACKGTYFDPETGYRAMLAASPFAMKEDEG